MAVPFACPGCATPFNITPELAGKRAKCPKCAMVFTLPGGAPAAKPKAEAAPVPSLPADLFPSADRDEPPRKRSRRPSRDDESDYDDRDEPAPPRRKKKASSSSALIWTLVIGGAAVVLLLFCGGGIAVIALIMANADPAPRRPVAPPPPVAGAKNPQPQPATRINLVKGEFSMKGQMTFADPIDPAMHGAAKRFEVQLQPGRTYIIDMQSDAFGFDPFLRLEDSKGQELSRDDDGGGGLNARIVFAPTRPDAYVIIATTLNNAQGPFTLTIREQRQDGPFKL